MTIKCGVCGNEIPSHMIDVKHGSHYTEHYEEEEHILHKDLGRILEVRVTDEINKKLDAIQQQKEHEIVTSVFKKIIPDKMLSPLSSWDDDIKTVKKLVNLLNSVIKEAENRKITIESGEIDNSLLIPRRKIGRHYDYHWDRLHIPRVDVCAKCFKWFEKPSMSIGSLNTVIPNLKLEKLNKDIWDDIKNCEVGIEFKDW